MQVSGLSGFAGAMLGMPGPASLAGKKLSDLDTNGDGTVSPAELRAALDQGQTDTGTSSTSDARFEDFFQKLDTDGDGKISSSEWSAFQQTGKQGSQAVSSVLDSQAMIAKLQSLVSQLYKAATADSDSQLSQNGLSEALGQSLNATSLSYAI